MWKSLTSANALLFVMNFNGGPITQSKIIPRGVLQDSQEPF